MASFMDTLVTTIEKDFELIGRQSDLPAKEIRKECSLLLKRIEKAKGLISEEKTLLKLTSIEDEVHKLKKSN